MDLVDCAATCPVDESPALDTAFLTKRKADSDPAEEVEESGDEMEYSGDEDEESGDENEKSGDEYVDSDDELMKPTWWTVPEWDVDSFDGLEYDSAEEEEHPFCNEEDYQKWRRFKRQFIENKGFDVEPELRPFYRYSSKYNSIRDLDLSAGFDQTWRELFSEMACLCLQKYNQEKGLNVEFVEVVRVNHTAASRWKSYITFMAKEKPDGPLVEYQAKAWSTLVEGDQHHPILCRPAPTAKPSNQN